MNRATFFFSVMFMLVSGSAFAQVERAEPSKPVRFDDELVVGEANQSVAYFQFRDEKSYAVSVQGFDQREAAAKFCAGFPGYQLADAIDVWVLSLGIEKSPLIRDAVVFDVSKLVGQAEAGGIFGWLVDSDRSASMPANADVFSIANGKGMDVDGSNLAEMNATIAKVSAERKIEFPPFKLHAVCVKNLKPSEE